MLYSVETRCPVCRAEAFQYTELLYETPYFGAVLVQVGRCNNCGYRFFDIEYGGVGRPTTIVFTARDGDDVIKSILIRSKTGSIHSPDLGFSLEPGLMGDPFITTVEGFLYRVIDYAERLKTLSPEVSERVEQFVQNVREKIERGGFKLVVEDPLGKSFIIPHRPESVETIHST